MTLCCFRLSLQRSSVLARNRWTSILSFLASYFLVFHMAANTDKEVSSAVELEHGRKDDGFRLDEKVKDGDDALKVLHGEFEPYTKEEEKRVLRKIDFRMIIVMLIINGLQFIDKNVSFSCDAEVIPKSPPF